MDNTLHGVKATIIDLGLARMNHIDHPSNPDYQVTGKPHFTMFDSIIFDGEGAVIGPPFRCLCYAADIFHF
jgi:hypothetical protein